MSVTTERLAQLPEGRLALEVLAARRAIKGRRNGPAGSEGLSKALGHLKVIARRKDPYGFGSADTTFHPELCRASRNKVLCAQWESLARQLTMILGLSVLGKSMNVVVEEHEGPRCFARATRPR
jgi:DNA-binding GntR family transcriptional regulator